MARELCAKSEWKSFSDFIFLAEILAGSGDFDQAIKFQEFALQMADADAADEKVKVGLREQLELYRSHKSAISSEVHKIWGTPK